MALRLRFVIAASVVAITTAFSCKTFDLPNETCDPSGLDAQRMHGEAAEGPCSRCLEDNCCDKVGVCANTDGCQDSVRGVHDCVLNAGINGAMQEQTCAKDLAAISEADSAYRCMRDSCGMTCGLPVCAVTSAAALFRNPDCDGCLAGACCTQLNDCYGSRSCKLSLECIGRDCGPELAQALIAQHAMGPSSSLMPPDSGSDLCTDAGAAAFDGMIAPECVRQCLCAYKDHDQGLMPPAAKQPLTLAFDVYRCAGDADCGPKCGTRLDSGTP